MRSTEWKFSGVISPCGMKRSNSPSTARMRFTVSSELSPASRSGWSGPAPGRPFLASMASTSASTRAARLVSREV